MHSIEMNFLQKYNMNNFVVILQNPSINLPVLYELNCLRTKSSCHEICLAIHKHVFATNQDKVFAPV